MLLNAVCAIDSLPLGPSIFETFDYSGLQVFTPAHISLSQSQRKAHSNVEGTRLNLQLDSTLHWNDGQPISAVDFGRGILKVFEANAFVKKFLFRNLERLEPLGSNLSVQFRKPNFRASDCFSIPNFVPFRDGYFSGPYAIESNHPGEFHYGRSPYSAAPIASLTVRQLKNPEENLTQYLEGSLDVTADTAFPMDRWDEFKNSPDFVIRDTGLRAYLLFEGALIAPGASCVRQAISEVASLTDFSNLLPWVGPVEKQIAKRSSPSNLHTLRLAYDAFYPNREVCEHLAETLQKFGNYSIELVEDDYYAPHQPCELRFAILRDLGPGRYLHYAPMPFNAVVRADVNLQKRILKALEQVEQEPNPNLLDSLYSNLDDMYSVAIPSVPLFRVRSCYLSRLPENANPLLAGFTLKENAL